MYQVWCQHAKGFKNIDRTILLTNGILTDRCKTIPSTLPRGGGAVDEFHHNRIRMHSIYSCINDIFLFAELVTLFSSLNNSHTHNKSHSLKFLEIYFFKHININVTSIFLKTSLKGKSTLILQKGLD